MKYVVYDPTTLVVDGVFEIHDQLFPQWPGLVTRRYNTGSDEEWAALIAEPWQYIVSEVDGFHLERNQNKLKSNEE